MARLHLEINSDATPSDGQVATYISSASEWQADFAASLHQKGYFGSGADGDLTTSGNVTLTRTMYYDNLTVGNGHTLSPNGHKIYVKGTLTVRGTGAIRSDGNAGTGASGSSGGNGGTAATTSLNFDLGANRAGGTGTKGGTVNGTNDTPVVPTNGAYAGGSRVNGGKGGSGSAGSGGTPATSGGTYATSVLANHLMSEVLYGAGVIHGGAGGGGGTGGGGDGVNSGGGGGGGGAGGRVIFIAAKNISVLGLISASGGDGGKGGDGTGGNSGGGGGGAGGGGGYILLVYETLSNSGTIRAQGGAGGAGGTLKGSGTDGSDGSDGNNGRVVKCNVKQGIFE